MSGILAEIIEHKRAEIAIRRTRRALSELRRDAARMPSPRGFAAALNSRRPAVIAEIKRASPSAGVIRRDFEVAAIARSYAGSGAAALSVLTDERYFQGANRYLAEARNACQLPILRKDFIVDPYQVFETRALGADCLLLIVAALDAVQLRELAQLADELALEVLIEVHNRRELDAALALDAQLVGINNRDLRTFATCFDTTLHLLEHVPSGVTVVAESGIHSQDDVRRLRAAGVEAFLVGTAFMRQSDPGAALQQLFALPE